jgi:hypothetical protein
LSSELSRASSPALVPCSTLSATTGFTDLEPWNSENTLAFVIILTTDLSERPIPYKRKSLQQQTALQRSSKDTMSFVLLNKPIPFLRHDLEAFKMENSE